MNQFGQLEQVDLLLVNLLIKNVVLLEKLSAICILLNVPKKIKPAVEYINNNYTQKVYTAHLAELCFLSESQMRRIFHSEFGMSPIEYKNNLCIKQACNMLKFTNSSISEIAREVGFGNLCFFSQTFKKITGVSPKQYSLKYRA